MGISTPLKAPLSSAAKVPKQATQESVDALSKKVDAMADTLAEILSTLESLKASSAPIPPSSLAPLSPPLDVARAVYETCDQFLRDKSNYADKERRAVVIGYKEKEDTAEGLVADQRLVSEIVDYCDSKEVKAAWDAQKISFHRHPVDRKPGSRPLKIDCSSKEVRDQLLSGIRAKVGRPTPFKGTLAFIRKDLTPLQLDMERTARDESKRRNIAAGKLICGVRDFSLVTYRTPRPLPTDYGVPRSRDARPAIHPNTTAGHTHSGALSSSTCPSDHSMHSSSGLPISAAPSSHVNTNRRGGVPR